MYIIYIYIYISYILNSTLHSLSSHDIVLFNHGSVLRNIYWKSVPLF